LGANSGSNFQIANADMNGDNAIDIDDITALINRILGN
jgi:hypothetical protein